MVSLKDLSASIWLWYRDNAMGNQEGIEIHRRACRSGNPTAAPTSFKAVPPLITDINLSLDDRFLYVSCFAPVSSCNTMSPIPTTRENRNQWTLVNRPQGCSS